jgi:hypothetical protein
MSQLMPWLGDPKDFFWQSKFHRPTATIVASSTPVLFAIHGSPLCSSGLNMLLA